MVATDQSLADSTIESEKANSSIHTSSQLLKHVNENFTPSFHQTLRQISSSQVLQLLAHERYVFIPYTTEKTMTNPRNFKKNFAPENIKKTALKSSILMAVCIFLSAALTAKTAQN